ncbi:MAG: hypothetical protein CMO77_07330 [Verrucomicrobiales bacterium]|nr:hypothetical protein [Verrucomicrobiales bacterium]
MPAGRPTSYSDDMLQQAAEYVDKGWREEGDVMPMIESLSVVLGVARSTIYKWAEEKPEFSDILDALMAVQAKELWNRGLVGDYNSTMAKLALTKHGYSDKSQSEVSGINGRPVEIEQDVVFRIVDSEDG